MVLTQTSKSLWKKLINLCPFDLLNDPQHFQMYEVVKLSMPPGGRVQYGGLLGNVVGHLSGESGLGQPLMKVCGNLCIWFKGLGLAYRLPPIDSSC